MTAALFAAGTVLVAGLAAHVAIRLADRIYERRLNRRIEVKHREWRP